MSIAAVQSRIAELQSAITAVSRPADAQATARTSDFGGVLARALTTQQTLAGTLGGASGAGTPGLAGAVGLTGTSLATSLAAAVAGATTPTASAAPAGAAVPAQQDGAVAAPGTGAALVESAKKYLGVPYVWGGESLAEGGLDCSGLVQRAMKDIGVDVPRVARDQMKIGTEVPSLDQARPGDLVVTRGGGHIGIYVGDNKWIHAPYPGEKVKLAEMTTPPTTIRRVLPS